MSTYRICDWSHRFENASSRKLKKLDWVAIPNSFDDDGYIVLVDHPNGAAHFAAWIAIVQIASRQKQKDRGILPNAKIGPGGICNSLARMTRLPANLFEEVFPRLIEIGWLEILAESPNASAEYPNASAESPSTLAESPSTLGKSADTDTYIHREGNIEKQRSTEEASSSSFHSNISFTGWENFLEAYQATGRETTEADLHACKPIWKKLQLADQIACVKGIRRDIEAHKYSGPEFWPKPKKYLFEREWERKPQRAQKVNGSAPHEAPRQPPVDPAKIIPYNPAEFKTPK